jgi:signal peptidase I
MQPTTLLADTAPGLARARFGAVRRARFAGTGRRPRLAAATRPRWSWLLVAAVVAVACGGVAYLREWPPLATVMSASMAPTIDTGDMVVLKRLDRPARVGDVVVVHVPDDARTRYGYPGVVIHRVVAIAPGGSVTTKGDARKEPDPFTLPRSALSAAVVARIPAGGSVLAFLGSGLGLLWLGGGAVLFVGMPLLDRRRHRAERESGGLRSRLDTITEELVELRYERIAERDALSRQLQQVTAAFTEHLERLPARIERAVAAAVAVEASTPETTRTPETAETAEVERATAEPDVAALAQLALALVPDCHAALAAADESEPQLAFRLDVERRPRFARPCDAQLELCIEQAAPASAQLSLAALAPRPAAPAPPPPPPPRRPGSPCPVVPTWDAAPVAAVRMGRRSGGLVGRALYLGAERWRAVAQAGS